MKKILLYIAVALFACAGSVAQSIPYNPASIPENVKKNASIITRSEDIVFEVTDIDRASYSVHRVITVLKDEGKHALSFVVHTSKYVSLDDAEIKVYDAAGKQISRARQKDMRTIADGDGLIDDGYATYYMASSPAYPVTVESNYVLKLKGTLAYPGYGISSPGEGVESSNFTAKVPKDLDLRYKMQNTSLKPEITEDGKYKLYKWTVKNMAPLVYEEGGSDRAYPSIELAPNQFSQYGFNGDLSSWKNFGQWIGNLYKGTDELPADRKAFFRDMVKDIPDKKDKIKAIYTYMQKNFRYVSIQLGVGGLKPFSAEFTDKKKYGDCKALSNFMKAALKSIDIKSSVAIINSDYNSEPVDPAFPANSFNHVILCVPMEKDTVWLECTSNTADFGILGTFTENRNTLLVTEDGGVLVPTPKSNYTNNRLFTHTTIALAEDGSGKTNTLFKSTGNFREQMDYILNEKKDDQKESIVLGIGFKQPDEFNFIKKESPAGIYATELDMSIEKIPEFTAGNKLFISPRIYKIWTHKMPAYEKRSVDYFFEDPFEQTDTTVLKLPAGYTSEALPKNKDLSCPYATYATNYWYDKDQKAVFSATRLVLKQHRIPAAAYADVKKFFDEVLMDDAQRIIVKKE